MYVANFHFLYKSVFIVYNCPVKRYSLFFTTWTGDVEFARLDLAEGRDEGATYAGAFLVDGVVGRIGDIVDALLHGGGGTVVHQ